jgi:tellurite resistance protein
MQLIAISRLARFPVGSFAVVVGLCGSALALREVERVLGFAGAATGALAFLAWAGFLVVSGLYLGKLFSGWAHVRAEFRDPVTMQSFPTLTISLLLVPLVVSPYQPSLSAPLWLVAAVAHLFLMIAMFRSWILQTLPAGAFSPVWVLSVGGNLVAAMGGARLGFIDLSWFFLSIGLLTCGALFIIAMYRFIFHDPFPALTPSLFILLPPRRLAFSPICNWRAGNWTYWPACCSFRRFSLLPFSPALRRYSCVPHSRSAGGPAHFRLQH